MSLVVGPDRIDSVFVSGRLWDQMKDADLFTRIVSENRIAEIDIPGQKYPMQVYRNTFIPDDQNTAYGVTLPDHLLDLFHKP